MSKLKVQVEEDHQGIGQRFIDAWKRAESGDLTEAHYVSFDSFETMIKVLTPSRVQVVRALRDGPECTVTALARRLNRNKSNIHGDLQALVGAGIIAREDKSYSAFKDTQVVVDI